MNKTIALSGALLILGASTQLAVAGATITFEGLDENHNGYISQSEAEADANLSQHWAEVDGDSDGKLTITEFDAYVGAGRYTPPEDAEIPEVGAAPY